MNGQAHCPIITPSSHISHQPFEPASDLGFRI
jgi:hypothetical protein